MLLKNPISLQKLYLTPQHTDHNSLFKIPVKAQKKRRYGYGGSCLLAEVLDGKLALKLLIAGVFGFESRSISTNAPESWWQQTEHYTLNLRKRRYISASVARKCCGSLSETSMVTKVPVTDLQSGHVVALR